MIDIKCMAPDTLKLHELRTFQGGLKRRTPKDIEALANSIMQDGLIMPLAVWKSENGNLLLDGHGRLAALTELALKDSELEDIDVPVIYIKADTEDEAKKSLLQITSSYGKIVAKEAIKFCATIPEYKAPAINKFVHKPVKKHKVEKQKTETVIRIRVPCDKEVQVRELLAQVGFIKVL